MNLLKFLCIAFVLWMAVVALAATVILAWGVIVVVRAVLGWLRPGRMLEWRARS